MHSGLKTRGGEEGSSEPLNPLWIRHCSSSDSKSGASEEADEASDVPDPASKNVPSFQTHVQQIPQNVSYGKAQDVDKIHGQERKQVSKF